MKKLLVFLFLPLQVLAQSGNTSFIQRWEREARQVTIIRDQWGIPHIYGKSDAACVFGLLYAQCEDDFPRIEMNYVEKLGRMAELKGESEIYEDLKIRMLIDSADAIADYHKSPAWLKKLLEAFADGINYFLYKNPSIKPALLHHFQPWYPLLWTDGSIGAINTGGISTAALKAFYEGSAEPVATRFSGEVFPAGSNGFAISPANTASGNAMLYINPHVSFYYRPEVHVISDEGLNSYGAVTWGQFFVYQGFNEHCGWMHTSSAVDVADLYEEKISGHGDVLVYAYGQSEKPIIRKKIIIHYRNGNAVGEKTIIAMYTHHGPVMTSRNGKWISLKAQNRSMTGLIQSWLRTKAVSFAGYKKIMDLRANTSNNTVYADAEGNIAYWHGNFIPVRDPRLSWNKPVDGSTAATEWKGLHTVDETVHVYNPPNGWIQNCNSTPFSVAGENSPKKETYPAYMAPDGENFRGINAVRILSKEKSFTIDKLIAAGYDNYLAAFEILIPALVAAYERMDSRDSLVNGLAEPISLLKAWDYRCSANSVATTLAVEWGQKELSAIVAGDEESETLDLVEKSKKYARSADPPALLGPLREIIGQLQKSFGRWSVAWGELNRYQRNGQDIENLFDDRLPSLPIGNTSSTWGCLPAFSSRYFPGNKKRYGIFGNSFICAVEFGRRIKAKSLLTGGESGHPDSKHFKDQADMYATGTFKEVLFYKEDVLNHAERTYHPGE